MATSSYLEEQNLSSGGSDQLTEDAPNCILSVIDAPININEPLKKNKKHPKLEDADKIRRLVCRWVIDSHVQFLLNIL